MTQKFIIHCDPENLILATRMVKHSIRIMEERASPQASFRFGNGVEMDSYYRDSGTIIVRQCEGG